jgi:hypothetical protein
VSHLTRSIYIHRHMLTVLPTFSTRSSHLARREPRQAPRRTPSPGQQVCDGRSRRRRGRGSTQDPRRRRPERQVARLQRVRQEVQEPGPGRIPRHQDGAHRLLRVDRGDRPADRGAEGSQTRGATRAAGREEGCSGGEGQGRAEAECGMHSCEPSTLFYSMLTLHAANPQEVDQRDGRPEGGAQAQRAAQGSREEEGREGSRPGGKAAHQGQDRGR